MSACPHDQFLTYGKGRKVETERWEFVPCCLAAGNFSQITDARVHGQAFEKTYLCNFSKGVKEVFREVMRH
nr:hypothetical protein CFP56_67890 [Quercus suber]